MRSPFKLLASRHGGAWFSLVTLALMTAGLMAIPRGAAPKQAALEQRGGVDDAQAQDIARFLQRHDKLLMDGEFETLLALYADDFYSVDLDNFSADSMIEHWAKLRLEYRSFKISTMPARIDQRGPYFAVSGCRPFASERFGQPVHDDLCHTIILRQLDSDDPESLEICGLYEIDHDKFDRLDDEEGVYRCENLGYEIGYPPGFFPIPHLNAGAEVDNIVFVSPEHHAQLSISVMDPTWPLSLEKAIEHNVGTATAELGTSVTAPTATEKDAAILSEMRYETPDANDVIHDDVTVGHLYWSPDQRFLFAIRLSAPTDSYGLCRDALEGAIDRIKLLTEPQNYATLIFSKNPQWQSIQDASYHHPTAPLIADLPRKSVATPLAGDYPHRARVHLPNAPDTMWIIRVYDPGLRDDFKMMLRGAERRFDELMQRGGFSMTERRFEERDLMDRGGALTFTYESESGDREIHRLVGFDCNGYHVQVHLKPGSFDEDGLDALLDEIVAGFRWSR